MTKKNDAADAEIQKKLNTIKAKSKHDAKMMAAKVKMQRGKRPAR